MAFTPTTEVRLLSVNFENDYKNVVYWSSLSAQETEMKACTVKTCTEFTYQRKDNIIRVPYHIDQLYNCNYVMYKNKSYTDKWFYAFITNMEYINDGRTDIKIETDVWGTWWNDITIKPSFVEREHVDDDTFGKHTYPEGLETGEYIINGNGFNDDNFLSNDDGKCYMVMAVTEEINSEGKFEACGGGEYGSCYSGLKYIGYNDIDVLNEALKKYNNGKIDAIQSIFIAPSVLMIVGDDNKITGVKKVSTWVSHESQIPTTLDGYKPRNNKLLTYPYTCLVVSNNQGSSAIYHNEKFYKYSNDGFRRFFGYGTLTPGCSIRTVPYNYNNVENNYDEGVNLGKYPICNWTSDVFTNWITQNGVNVATSAASGLTNMFTGASMAGTADAAKTLGTALMGAAAVTMGGPVGIAMGVGAMVNGALQIADTIGTMVAHSVMPDQARGNINCGDVNYAMKRNTFTYIDMSIKKEYAKIIDSYFDMYGYKCNMVKVPLANHRPVWWYTKTIAVNINGAIPQEDLAKIKNIYNNGVTFWKVHSQVENYKLDNTL